MSFRVRFILILFAWAPLSLGQSNVCDLLPSQAILTLQQKFPDWRPKNLADLDGYDKKLWLEMHPKACPGIAVGHFEQSDHLAYAILLVPKRRAMSGYKVIVLSGQSDKFLVRLLDHANGSDSGLIISKEPHGTYSNFGDSQLVHRKLDAVNVEWLEKSSVLYYWSHGGYLSMPTSD